MKGKKFYIILGIGIVAIVLLIVAVKVFKSGNITRASDTEMPEIRIIESKTFASGTIVPYKEVEIKAHVSGIIDDIYVGIGDEVKKGDKLVKIKLVPDPESVNSAESAVKIARVNVGEAEKEYERQRQLFEAGIIPEVEFSRAKADYKIRQEELTRTENSLQLIKEGSAKEFMGSSNYITSTLDGTVLEIPVKEGSSVIGKSAFSEGSVIMSVADLNRLTFQGKVGESDVGKLKLGMRLGLTIGAIDNEKFEAVLGFIAPKGEKEQIDGTTRFDISAMVVPKDGFMIRPGYSANVEIVLEKKDSVLCIKEKNIEFRNDSAFVEVLTDGNKFEERYIELGLSDGIYTEVSKGLGKTEKVKTGAMSEKTTVNIGL